MSVGGWLVPSLTRQTRVVQARRGIGLLAGHLRPGGFALSPLLSDDEGIRDGLSSMMSESGKSGRESRACLEHALRPALQLRLAGGAVSRGHGR